MKAAREPTGHFEALAADELHRDEALAADIANLVNGDDMRVAEPGHRLGLAQDPLPALRGCGSAGAQHLDRDLAIKALIVRGVDDPHPTGPEAIEHAKAADANLLWSTAKEPRAGELLEPVHLDLVTAEGSELLRGRSLRNTGIRQRGSGLRRARRLVRPLAPHGRSVASADPPVDSGRAQGPKFWACADRPQWGLGARLCSRYPPQRWSQS